MSRTLTFSPGVGPDVAVRDGQVHLVFGHQPWTWLVLSRDGELVGKAEQRVGYYPKTNGQIALAHDGERFLSWARGDGVDIPPGVPVGVHATGVSRSGQRFFYRQGDGVFTQTGAYCETVALPNPWASYGLWESRDDGTCKTWDECYYGPKPGIAGQVYHDPGGRLIVGEGGSGGVTGTIDGQLFLLWPGQDTKWPRCSVEGELVAICAWGDPGPQVRLWIGTAAELRELAPAEPVLPPVPPQLSGRELWLGYFFALSDRPAESGYGDNLSAPGNCTIVLTDAEARRSPWPYYAPPGVGEGPRKIASWVNVAKGEAWPNVGPHDLALYDGGEVLPDTPCPTGLTGIECYSAPGAALGVLEQNLRQWLSRWPTAPVALIGQAYTRNGLETNRQKLADLQGLPLRLAVDFPQIRAMLWFSDGRPTGTRSNEWWRPVHEQAAALVRSPWTMSNHLDTVRAERAKYPAPEYDAAGTLLNPMGNANAWAISNAVAYTHRTDGWGLLDKPAGNNHRGYSVDVICNATTKEIVDCLGASEAECVPQWSTITWDDSYVERWRPALPPEPVTPPPQPPPSGDLEQRVAYLEAVLPIYGDRIRRIEAALKACGEAMPV